MSPTPPEFNVLACPLAGERFIEASAGTGKTWTLATLYLRLLLEPEAPPEVAQILVVTFTEAATAELRDRIRSRIVELLAHVDIPDAAPATGIAARLIDRARALGRDDVSIRKRLQAALHHYDEAAIHTIHGFCRRTLDSAPFATGLPFALELVEDDSDLRREAVNDFWRRHVATAALPPLLAAELLRQKDSPKAWSDLVARRMAKPLAQWRWPAAAPAPIDVAAIATAYAAARDAWHRDGLAALALVEVAAGDGVLNRTYYNSDAIAAAAAGWNRCFAAKEALASLDPEWKLAHLGAAMLSRRTNKNRTAPEHPFFTAAQAFLDARGAAERSVALSRLRLLRQLTEEVPPDFARRKRERRVAGFDDLLVHLFEALRGPDGERLAAGLRRQFRAALIDEFQDTDPVQYGIFSSIFAGQAAPWFVVGDPKQAIYGFRNADVYAYLAARDQAGDWSTLAANQRATPALIDAQNALFGTNSRAFVVDAIGYVPVHAGERERSALADPLGPRGDQVAWTLPLDRDMAMKRADALAAATAATAAEIARLLAGARRGDVTLDGAPLGGRDIAVLVRSHAQARRMREALATLGVGSVVRSRDSVFATADADDLARVLAAIAEPAHAALTRAALATVTLGRTATEIDALGDDAPALADIGARFAGYRDDWIERGFGVMLRRLVTGEGVLARLLAGADGERRITNLRHLGELLQRAAHDHRAPDALLAWLAAQRDEPRATDATLVRLESERDLVQIITIHQSKGLEFAVTFCPYLFDGHRKSGRRAAGALEYHEGGAAVVDFAPPEDDGERAALELRIRLEEAAENSRLAYVALTRARNRCYMIGGAYVTGKTSTRESSNAPLNWLVAGEGTPPAAWFHKESAAPSAATIETAYRALAAKAPAAIALSPLPVAPGVALESITVSVDALAARTPPRHIADRWRIGSFSGLQYGAQREGAAADHDARPATDATRAEPPADVPPFDILRFPRGRGAGDCLHAVFERADFADATTWDAAIGQALREHPQAGDQAALAAMASSMLADVTAAPLPGGFALRDVAPGRRITELEFHLPAPHLAPAALQPALRALGYDVPRLAAPVLAGFLKGFIDLVFEHGHRWYVLDWKSNFLGWTAADYGGAALAAAMREHGYHLQSLLYALALDRMLRHRLAHYAPADHFGGVLYLFVRGVRPGWSQSGGATAGVHFDRPSAATLAQLASLLGPTGEERAA